jgi:hypothetical protein
LHTAPNLAVLPATSNPGSAEASDEGSGKRPDLRTRIQRIGDRTVARAAVSALVLGVLLHMRYGYEAGGWDQVVLSALGLHWAHPDEFANDWILANAPQPHWLFDVVTWFGAKTGTLGAVYLTYWMISLAVFGAATAILARAWAQGREWFATIAVTVLAAATPWWLLGTGSPMLALALPGVLGGYLVYLCAAGLLLDRRRLTAVTAIATALVHVQQGGVVAVLLLTTVAVRWARTRRFDVLLFASGLACAAIVGVVLRLRPVAGHLSDFAQACHLLIPGHCDANTWSKAIIIGGVSLVGLALVSIVYLPAARDRWVIVLLLPAVGLILGVSADRFDVPFFGILAQGLNIYRLDVLLMPFAVWALISPIAAPLSPRGRWRTLAVVTALSILALGQGGWALNNEYGLPFSLITLAGLVALCALTTRLRQPANARLIRSLASAAVVLGVLTSGLVGRAYTIRPFDPHFISDPDMRAWGAAVQRHVPPGEQIVAAPLAVYVRLTTRRGVVVDCKNGPYGGPAWQEYRARMDSLGGFDQCLTLEPWAFNELPPDHIVNVAKRYGADYLLVERWQRWRMPYFQSMGWTIELGPVGSIDNYLLKAPWVH